MSWWRWTEKERYYLHIRHSPSASGEIGFEWWTFSIGQQETVPWCHEQQLQNDTSFKSLMSELCFCMQQILKCDWKKNRRFFYSKQKKIFESKYNWNSAVLRIQTDTEFASNWINSFMLNFTTPIETWCNWTLRNTISPTEYYPTKLTRPIHNAVGWSPCRVSHSWSKFWTNIIHFYRLQTSICIRLLSVIYCWPKMMN